MTDKPVVLIPDSGPLITLAYANTLDLLLKPGWPVSIIDMVLHEVTRNKTPSSSKISRWIKSRKPVIVPTQIFQRYSEALASDETLPRKSNLGELAAQEAMNVFALDPKGARGVFLFEDHRIAKAGFILPDGCKKVSTRAYLIFLERQGWIPSAADVERRAVLAGRVFSQLRFPSE